MLLWPDDAGTKILPWSASELTLSYMSEMLMVSRRRSVPRTSVAAGCWEVIEGKERRAGVVDLSWEGVRLERPFCGGPTPGSVQLELDVAGLDEVIWAKAGACFDEVVPVPRGSMIGGPMGLVRRTGFRLLAAAARDLRLLREYLFEQRRLAQAMNPGGREPEALPARKRSPLPSLLEREAAKRKAIAEAVAEARQQADLERMATD